MKNPYKLIGPRTKVIKESLYLICVYFKGKILLFAMIVVYQYHKGSHSFSLLITKNTAVRWEIQNSHR